jgi:hypothetical protein
MRWPGYGKEWIMKPTLPEDREPDETGADVSERYRDVSHDEPPPRLDARIIEAARREVAQPVQRKWLRNPLRREWQVPASIAAVLVIAVSLGLIVRDNEPPLLPTESSRATHSPTEEAKLAKPAPPQLAMKAEAKSRIESDRESRPSRDRSDRPDRQLLARAAPGSSQANGAAAAIQQVPASPPAQGPAAAAPAPQVADALDAKVREHEQAPAPEAASERAEKKAESAATFTKNTGALQALRKQDKAKQVPEAEDWIHKIEDLLAAGKQAEAKDQLGALRARYPDYPLPERLQALLPQR